MRLLNANSIDCIQHPQLEGCIYMWKVGCGALLEYLPSLAPKADSEKEPYTRQPTSNDEGPIACGALERGAISWKLKAKIQLDTWVWNRTVSSTHLCKGKKKKKNRKTKVIAKAIHTCPDYRNTQSHAPLQKLLVSPMSLMGGGGYWSKAMHG